MFLFLILQLSILLRTQIIWLIVFIIKMINIIESSWLILLFTSINIIENSNHMFFNLKSSVLLSA